MPYKSESELVRAEIEPAIAQGILEQDDTTRPHWEFVYDPGYTVWTQYNKARQEWLMSLDHSEGPVGSFSNFGDLIKAYKRSYTDFGMPVPKIPGGKGAPSPARVEQVTTELYDLSNVGGRMTPDQKNKYDALLVEYRQLTGNPKPGFIVGHTGLRRWVLSNCEFALKTADFDRTRTFTDYDRPVHQSTVVPDEDGFSVIGLEDKEPILRFKDRPTAEDFASKFDKANLRRKNVSRVFEEFLPLSIEKRREPVSMPESGFDRQQRERDLLLAPQTFTERRERFKKLKDEGLPFVPEMKKEIEEFRDKPAKPHGVEKPAPKGAPDVPTVEELRRKPVVPLRLVATWLRSSCRFAG